MYQAPLTPEQTEEIARQVAKDLGYSPQKTEEYVAGVIGRAREPPSELLKRVEIYPASPEPSPPFYYKPTPEPPTVTEPTPVLPTETVVGQITTAQETLQEMESQLREYLGWRAPYTHYTLEQWISGSAAGGKEELYPGKYEEYKKFYEEEYKPFYEAEYKPAYEAFKPYIGVAEKFKAAMVPLVEKGLVIKLGEFYELAKALGEYTAGEIAILKKAGFVTDPMAAWRRTPVWEAATAEKWLAEPFDKSLGWYLSEKQLSAQFMHNIRAVGRVVIPTVQTVVSLMPAGFIGMYTIGGLPEMAAGFAAATKAIGGGLALVAKEGAHQISSGITAAAEYMGPTVQMKTAETLSVAGIKGVEVAGWLARWAPPTIETYLTRERLEAGMHPALAGAQAAFELSLMYGVSYAFIRAITTPMYTFAPGAPSTVTELTKKGWVTYPKYSQKLKGLERIERAFAIRYGETVPYIPYKAQPLGMERILATVGYKLRPGEALIRPWEYKPLSLEAGAMKLGEEGFMAGFVETYRPSAGVMLVKARAVTPSWMRVITTYEHVFPPLTQKVTTWAQGPWGLGHKVMVSTKPSQEIIAMSKFTQVFRDSSRSYEMWGRKLMYELERITRIRYPSIETATGGLRQSMAGAIRPELTLPGAGIAGLSELTAMQTAVSVQIAAAAMTASASFMPWMAPIFEAEEAEQVSPFLVPKFKTDVARGVASVQANLQQSMTRLQQQLGQQSRLGQQLGEQLGQQSGIAQALAQAQAQSLVQAQALAQAQMMQTIQAQLQVTTTPIKLPPFLVPLGEMGAKKFFKPPKRRIPKTKPFLRYWPVGDIERLFERDSKTMMRKIGGALSGREQREMFRMPKPKLPKIRLPVFEDPFEKPRKRRRRRK